jgi:hydroxyisourate hydrolase
MSQITTHILDTSLGKPAANVNILLEEENNGVWRELARGKTDGDGRIKNLLSESTTVEPGVYRLVFDVGAYYSSMNIKTFYPSVKIEFRITDKTHYHVPLLLNPFGYTTYRGS